MRCVNTWKRLASSREGQPLTRRERSPSLRDVLLAVVGVLVVWQLAAMVIDKPVLPPPWDVLRAFVLALPEDLGKHLLVSAWRVVASILLAVVTAVPAGLALGLSPTVDRLAAPLIYLLYPIPKIVFLPVIILLLGIGNVSKVFIIALILFFQMLVVVRDEAANLRPELLALAQPLRYSFLPSRSQHPLGWATISS